MEYKKVLERMNEMERESAKYPNLMQTYEVMWNALKEELYYDKINSEIKQKPTL